MSDLSKLSSPRTQRLRKGSGTRIEVSLFRPCDQQNFLPGATCAAVIIYLEAWSALRGDMRVQPLAADTLAGMLNMYVVLHISGRHRWDINSLRTGLVSCLSTAFT